MYLQAAGKHAFTSNRIAPQISFVFTRMLRTCFCNRAATSESDNSHGICDSVKKSKENHKTTSGKEDGHLPAGDCDEDVSQSIPDKDLNTRLQSEDSQIKYRNNLPMKRSPHLGLSRRRGLSPSQRLGSLLEASVSGQTEHIEKVKELIQQLDPYLQTDTSCSNQQYATEDLCKEPLITDHNRYTCIDQNRCFSIDELVKIKIFHPKRNKFVSERLVLLEHHKKYNLPNHGDIDVSQMIGLENGAMVVTSTGNAVMLVKPSLGDYLKLTKRYTWAPDPKVRSLKSM